MPNSNGAQINEEDEPPLLEDLGIEPDKIKAKYWAILTQRGIKEVAAYDDMAGTLFVLFVFGVLLLLVSANQESLTLLFFLVQKGKIQFGNIYGVALTGCIGICLLINLLTKKGVYVELYSTMSILGYSLLPFIFLTAGSLFIELINPLGLAFSLLIILWSTGTATRFF